MSESSVSKLNSLLLLLVIGLLVWGIVSKPRSETRRSEIGRFQPIPGSPFLALDTKTGKACTVSPNPSGVVAQGKRPDPDFIPDPIQSEPLSPCSQSE